MPDSQTIPLLPCARARTHPHPHTLPYDKFLGVHGYTINGSGEQ